MTAPHDRPTASELVESVREFLERDVMAETDGRVQWHTRVAINVLGMVERELRLGPHQATAHQAGLARLGMRDDADLCSAIRNGTFDEDRLVELAEFLRETVRAKLEVANPGYLEDPLPKRTW